MLLFQYSSKLRHLATTKYPSYKATQPSIILSVHCLSLLSIWWVSLLCVLWSIPIFNELNKYFDYCIQININSITICMSMECVLGWDLVRVLSNKVNQSLFELSMREIIEPSRTRILKKQPTAQFVWGRIKHCKTAHISNFIRCCLCTSNINEQISVWLTHISI